MNKSTLKRALLIGGICMAVPLAALAARPMMSGPGDCDRPMASGQGPEAGQVRKMGMAPYLRKLDLTQEQRDKIFTLMRAEGPRMKEQSQVLRKQRMALRELSLSADFDPVRAKELADSGAVAMVDMALARAKLENEIFQILDPEQRQRLQAMAPSMGGGHEGHFHSKWRSN